MELLNDSIAEIKSAINPYARALIGLCASDVGDEAMIISSCFSCKMLLLVAY